MDNFPKWALRAVAGVLLAITMFFSNRAIAENDKTKAVAYEARSQANKAIDAVAMLQAQVADVRGAIEINRKESREDRVYAYQQIQSMEEKMLRALKNN